MRTIARLLHHIADWLYTEPTDRLESYFDAVVSEPLTSASTPFVGVFPYFTEDLEASSSTIAALTLERLRVLTSTDTDG